jgi:hypothetical protein
VRCGAGNGRQKAAVAAAQARLRQPAAAAPLADPLKTVPQLVQQLKLRIDLRSNDLESPAQLAAAGRNGDCLG